jgi:hypothetical protein
MSGRAVMSRVHKSWGNIAGNNEVPPAPPLLPFLTHADSHPPAHSLACDGQWNAQTCRIHSQINRRNLCAGCVGCSNHLCCRCIVQHHCGVMVCVAHAAETHVTRQKRARGYQQHTQNRSTNNSRKTRLKHAKKVRCNVKDRLWDVGGRGGGGSNVPSSLKRGGFMQNPVVLLQSLPYVGTVGTGVVVTHTSLEPCDFCTDTR